LPLLSAVPALTLYLNHSGDTGKLCLHAKDSDGNPLDLGLFTAVEFILQRMSGDPDDAAVFTAGLSSGLSLSSPSDDGVAEVTIPKTTVAAMMTGRAYPWRLKVTNGTGEVSSAQSGKLVIRP
jgi:hypothetical protein